MQAATYHGQRDVRIEQIEPTEVGPNDVRIAVAACGICGTDLHEYAAGPIDTPGDDPHPITGAEVPIRFGHEFGGRVIAIGSAVSAFETGDLVTVNPLLTCGECRYCEEGKYNTCVNIGTIGLSGGDGGFAEEAVIHESHVIPVPEGVPAEFTALVEPLAVGVHAVRASEMELGDDIAVVGAGPIGLATALAAKAEGASQVLVSASRDSRRAIAREIGVDAVVDPSGTDPVDFVNARTDDGVAVAFEAAGSRHSLDQAVQCTTRDGNVTVISLFEDSIDFDPNPIVHGERTLQGIFGYQAGPLGNRDYRTVLRLLARNDIDPEPLVTSRIDLPTIVESGFERLLDRSSGQVKILVNP